MKQIKNLRSTELGNSLLIVAVLIGLAAVLGVVGFFLWNKIQQEQSPKQTSPKVSVQNRETPPPSVDSNTVAPTNSPEVKAAKTVTDLDAYLADLDKSDVSSLDNPQ